MVMCSTNKINFSSAVSNCLYMQQKRTLICIVFDIGIGAFIPYNLYDKLFL